MEWNEDQIETHIYRTKQPYFPMWEQQKRWVEEIDEQSRLQALLLLEHDHVYTFGRGGHKEHLLISEEVCAEKGIELADIDRGGDITYHGPGQLVGYPLLHLERYRNDAHSYLRTLEETIIHTLQHFGIDAERKEPYTGVWVKEEKIAAIGVKFNRAKQAKGFITSHGFALNVHTDLMMFEYIIPCGIREYGVTSMAKILQEACPAMEDVIQVLQQEFMQQFKLQMNEQIIYEK